MKRLLIATLFVANSLMIAAPAAKPTPAQVAAAQQKDFEKKFSTALETIVNSGHSSLGNWAKTVGASFKQLLPAKGTPQEKFEYLLQRAGAIDPKVMEQVIAKIQKIQADKFGDDGKKLVNYIIDQFAAGAGLDAQALKDIAANFTK